jgi:hypothetical protein
MHNLPRRLRNLKVDPWEGYFEIRDSQKLDARKRETVGLT